jgi:hypothetical protein
MFKLKPLRKVPAFGSHFSLSLLSRCSEFMPLFLVGEATNTNFIVFGLTRPGLDPTIYHTRGEHANHYTTDAVDF